MLFHDFADLDERTQYWFMLQVFFIPWILRISFFFKPTNPKDELA